MNTDERFREIENRVSKLESKTESLQIQTQKTQSHLISMRDSINSMDKVINEIKLLTVELRMTNENQSRILNEIQHDRENEKNNRQKYIFWFITCVGAIIITALMSLIII